MPLFGVHRQKEVCDEGLQSGGTGALVPLPQRPWKTCRI